MYRGVDFFILRANLERSLTADVFWRDSTVKFLSRSSFMGDHIQVITIAKLAMRPCPIVTKEH